MSRPQSALLTDREVEITTVLWDLKAATAKEIRQRLSGQPHDSTVRTLLRVLVSKGHVLIDNDSRPAVYKPRVRQNSVRRKAAHNVVAEAISKQIGIPCHLRLTRKLAPVYVATGDYRFEPLPANISEATPLSDKVAKLAHGEFWIPFHRTKYTGTVVQSFEDFLAVWSEVFLLPIIDQVSHRPMNGAFFMTFACDAVAPMLNPLTAEQEKLVVQRFCDQTGLQLTKSRRQIPVARVVVRDAN